jgi:hypothetical protein
MVWSVAAVACVCVVVLAEAALRAAVLALFTLTVMPLAFLLIQEGSASVLTLLKPASLSILAGLTDDL